MTFLLTKTDFEAYISFTALEPGVGRRLLDFAHVVAQSDTSMLGGF